ncbi:lipoprotein insertase outer membrane protein LolB [Aquitalea magnusonii]|uniref:lipoprotein insertase outer membrane protein LolB n=1 Tax=Aquitalea magnusonii TaxID=332411 RepID=UPI001EFAADBE|nr:lipoprotein insertase outer membrane protein LolB [Aquitalea magnusonii]
MKCPLLVAVLAGSLLLAGCATETVFRPAGSASSAVQDRPFTVSGRISINMDGKGSVGQFDWSHQPQADQLSVNSPLGSTMAQLRRDASGVTLLADGKSWQAANVEDLTHDVLGWTLPLGNLVWWIRGLPAPDAPYQFASDGSLDSRAGPYALSAMPTRQASIPNGWKCSVTNSPCVCCRKTGAKR